MKWLLGVCVLCVVLGASSMSWAECRVLSSAVTYTAGQLKDLVCGTDGTLRVGGGPGSATAAAPTLAEGDAGYFSFDLIGNARVTLGTCLSGESACVTTSSDSYIMVRTDLLASTQKSADAQIKDSPGYVGNLICTGDASAAASGTIIVYNSLTETGTVLYTLNITSGLDYHLPMTIPINTSASIGIYLGYATVSDVNCTVFYR